MQGIVKRRKDFFKTGRQTFISSPETSYVTNRTNSDFNHYLAFLMVGFHVPVGFNYTF